MSMVYLNDQTCGISKLNKLVIALENKKNSYTCMLLRVCFLSKNQIENLKRKCFFWGGGGVIPLGYTGHDIVK